MNIKLNEKIFGLTLFTLLLATVTHAQTFTTIADPSATQGTTVTAISGSSYVGSYQGAHSQQGFYYNGSSYQNIGPTTATGYNGNTANGISGNYVSGVWFDTSSQQHGYLYNISANSYTLLDDPSAATGANRGTGAQGIDGNTVVGYYYLASGNAQGFTYSISGGTYTTLAGGSLGATSLFAEDISGNNIVGYYQIGSAAYSGFLFDGTSYITLNDPLAVNGTQAWGIDGNYVVGNFRGSSGANQGFVYDISTGTYTTLNGPGAPATMPYGIDNTNVVGYYLDSSYAGHGFETGITPTATPEPNVLALCSLGGLGSFFLFRRRK